MMTFIKQNIKNIIIIILFILLTSSFLFIYYLLKEEDDKKVSYITGTVLVSDENYVIIETTEEDYLVNNIKGTYNIGDKVKFTYLEKDIEENTNPKTIKISDEELLESNVEKDTDIKEENKVQEENNETVKNETNSNNTSNSTSNATSNISDNKNNSENTEQKSADEEVLSYVNSLKNDIENKNVTSTLKSGFITVVDFLFYKGTIKGHTLSELSNSAKLKVLSVALYLDNKIDTYFPGYKESITTSTKKIYTNIKSKIVEAYLNVTTSICENNTDACTSAKEGFSELKTNFGLTWSLIKDIAGDGLTNLKYWYEIWSGK